MKIYSTIADAISHAARTVRAPLVWDPVGHLLNRFTFGPTAMTRASLASVGPSTWYRQHVAYGATDQGYAGNPAVAAACPLLAMTPPQLRAHFISQDDEFSWQAMDQLTWATLGLQAWSRAQMYETLVDFFNDLLHVTNHIDGGHITRADYDREVIRKHAMGSYTEMLKASAKHPAMLIYLNLAESTKTEVNENYGRELLELHTVGLIYSEDDVKNASLLLTGRGVNDNGQYVYDRYNHPTGAVKVLGFTHANASTLDGAAGGDALVEYLAKHPATANRIALKMCQRYVSDNPSSALVAAVAKVYLTSGTQIMPMVAAIIRSDEFWSSRGAKVRRPAENMIATMRILDVKPANVADALDTMTWMARDLSNLPLEWAAPDGYPDDAGSWRSSSTLIRMWEQHLGFVGGWWDSFAKADRTKLYGRTPTTSGDAINLLTRRLTGQLFTPAHQAALQSFLQEPANTPYADSRLEWLLEPLVALILNGPHHALR